MEIAWVIECGAEPLYWDGRSTSASAFVRKHDEAVRFARFEDAERVRCWLFRDFGFALRSTQHGWAVADASSTPDHGGWRPIDSAPKDGTWIILLMRNGQVWKASWGRDRQNEMHWCTDKLSLAGCVVTHWMPLPPAPDKA